MKPRARVTDKERIKRLKEKGYEHLFLAKIAFLAAKKLEARRGK